MVIKNISTDKYNRIIPFRAENCLINCEFNGNYLNLQIENLYDNL